MDLPLSKLVISPQTNVLIYNKQPKRIIEYPFWFGGVASSMTHAIINHPYDMIKVRMETRQIATKPFLIYSAATRPSAVYLTMERIVTHEGIRGLYRGLYSGILGQVAYSTLRFGIYGKLKNTITKIQEQLTFTKRFFCASLSGYIGGFFGMPPLIVITRMQENEHLRNFSGLCHILKNYGFGNFKNDDNTLTYIISGILASLVTTTIVSPVHQVNNVIKHSSKPLLFGSFNDFDPGP
ncbi:mitochondrial carrier [Rhizophagus clarus]|uniref:Mitochondrial carrier n=1 Tax=Rhizophagus clarus TaxID=94130 RepID=A0A8H3KSQ8_9GLOM|nr:mitochondrial carrier [Rhizophagus clarus]